MISNEYILFIDTETSDKPRKWTAPTSHTDKWPYLLQVAWVICDNKGEVVKSRDFYINPGEISIHEDSLNIHGITLEFLKEKGKKRKRVLKKLSDDLDTYQPLIVGHFLKFDIKMLEVGFERVKIRQNLTRYLKFCTMINTRSNLSHLPLQRLGELYESLFDENLENPHNASFDALATKACFFELVMRGGINDKIIEHQQKYFKLPDKRNKFFSRRNKD